jgi:hypothetical protein
VRILQRIKHAITRAGSSAGPALSGGAASTQMGFEQIEAAEHEEFPPEELRAEENGESES